MGGASSGKGFLDLTKAGDVASLWLRVYFPTIVNVPSQLSLSRHEWCADYDKVLATCCIINV